MTGEGFARKLSWPKILFQHMCRWCGGVTEKRRTRIRIDGSQTEIRNQDPLNITQEY
jgi:hypothetical protein